MTSTKEFDNKRTKKSVITSTIITLVIVLMLIISGPATAVTVSITGLPSSITKGTSETFTVQITIEDPDNYVPVSNFSLDITGATQKGAIFDTSGNKLSGDSGISVSPVSTPGSSNYGYGYGYGLDAGYGYNFGYGYGYGYGYGAGGGSVTYEYSITLDTSILNTGSHTAVAGLNTGDAQKPSFSSSPVAFSITSVRRSGSGGGGGSGSAGVTTSEPYNNIEKAERHDKTLFAGKPVTYTFTAPELGVYEVVVTGEANEYDIALRVEALKATSKLVSVSAPGAVYKNLNVWAGTKRIKEALIRFKVENSWLDSNNIATGNVKMVRWDGSKWVQLDTIQNTKENPHTYYEAKTGGFSLFAIVGLKEGEVIPTEADATLKPIDGTTPAGEMTPAPEATEEKKGFLPGFEIFAAILAVTGALYLRNKERR